jgi:hypothetical protein
MTDRDELTSTEQLDQTTTAEAPAADTPDPSAPPTSTPLTHHEPPEVHAPDMEGVGGHADDHAAADHGDGHGHAEARLGAIDWGGWGYALVGVVAGLLVVAAFWLAIA